MNTAPKIGELFAVPNSAGMGCTVLALCAVTGGSREEIESLLRRLGVEDFSSIPPRLWAQALPLLGSDHRIVSDDTIQPPIYSFMEEHSYPGLLLVVATENGGRGHVFAAKGRSFVDFYTDGQIATHVPPPKGSPEFRVKHVVLVRPRGGSTASE
jgi:hypothetical protein